MRNELPLKICLGLGLASYCLVILVSQDAPVPVLALMGGVALALSAVSMGLMWLSCSDSDAETIDLDSEKNLIE